MARSHSALLLPHCVPAALRGTTFSLQPDVYGKSFGVNLSFSKAVEGHLRSRFRRFALRAKC